MRNCLATPLDACRAEGDALPPPLFEVPLNISMPIGKLNGNRPDFSPHSWAACEYPAVLYLVPFPTDKAAKALHELLDFENAIAHAGKLVDDYETLSLGKASRFHTAHT